MYDLINEHVQVVLDGLPDGHVPGYDFLSTNVAHAAEEEYQHAYKQYWRMHRFITNPAYFDTYFHELQNAQANIPTVSVLAQRLYLTPIRPNGPQSLQFSFAAKLLNVVDGRIPIYDSRVAAFYFFQEDDGAVPLPVRIHALTDFHSFLSKEYRRVLGERLLQHSIEQFRHQLNPAHFTDEKIIDSLIWSFAGILLGGGLPARQIIYH